MSQMGGSALISYYLVLILQTIGITDPDTQTLINGILSIWNWLVACSGALSVDRLGRRFLWLTAIGGMLVSFCVWTGLSAAFEHSRSSHLGTAVLAMIFIFNGFYAFGVTPLSFSNLTVPGHSAGADKFQATMSKFYPFTHVKRALAYPT